MLPVRGVRNDRREQSEHAARAWREVRMPRGRLYEGGSVQRLAPQAVAGLSAMVSEPEGPSPALSAPRIIEE